MYVLLISVWSEGTFDSYCILGDLFDQQDKIKIHTRTHTHTRTQLKQIEHVHFVSTLSTLTACLGMLILGITEKKNPRDLPPWLPDLPPQPPFVKGTVNARRFVMRNKQCLEWEVRHGTCTVNAYIARSFYLWIVLCLPAGELSASASCICSNRVWRSWMRMSFSWTRCSRRWIFACRIYINNNNKWSKQFWQEAASHGRRIFRRRKVNATPVSPEQCSRLWQCRWCRIDFLLRTPVHRSSDLRCFSLQGPRSHGVQGSVDPHFFEYAVHMRRLTPTFCQLFRLRPPLIVTFRGLCFNGSDNHHKLPLPLRDLDLDPSNTWFLGPTRVYPPIGIWIRSTVFAGLMNVTSRQTDRQTDHATLSVAIDCIYISYCCYAA